MLLEDWAYNLFFCRLVVTPYLLRLIWSIKVASLVYEIIATSLCKMSFRIFPEIMSRIWSLWLQKVYFPAPWSLQVCYQFYKSDERYFLRIHWPTYVRCFSFSAKFMRKAVGHSKDITSLEVIALQISAKIESMTVDKSVCK